MENAAAHNFWPLVLAVLTILVPVIATGHIVLTKRDTKAAIGWAGVVWLAPYLGTVLYLIFGINRIRRRASRLRPQPAHPRTRRPGGERRRSTDQTGEDRTFSDLITNITGLPLTQGNRVTPLVNGEAAYPEMIAAIDDATHTVALSTYIFDNDRAGTMFADALAAATARGVEVRVLVDSMGGRYSFPRMLSRLNRRGVPVAEFLHSFIPWRMNYLNLRNHRKILVADGRVGFTGGMNIREGHLVESAGKRAIQDLHFKVEGPVVEQLMNMFAEDWAFATGEVLSGDGWFPTLEEKGEVAARGIAAGPDEDFDRLRWVLMAALAEARHAVRIITPYFVPEDVTTTALNLAAMSGIELDILVPARNNLKMVQWASQGHMPQLLEHGCRIWETPPPFDHTKLMLVDDRWALIGSANWDPRSLFLNFEFNLECYGRALVRELIALFESKRAAARQITLDDLRNRPLPVKLRDGFARMLSPYL
ncbi:MAG: cardiolipin synthase [Alphaproteobacteria bacterium]|nr:MAG: cardiolipin synthase [Alphaproteobacteria bacterium]